MSEFNPSDLATALVGLGVTVHESNKNADEVNSIELLRNMAKEIGYDPDDLVSWLDEDGERTTVHDFTNHGGGIDWDVTHETFQSFTYEEALHIKNIIEDILEDVSLDPKLVEGVKLALLRAFP